MQTHPLETFKRRHSASRRIARPERRLFLSFFKRKIPRKVLVDFTRSFALMIKARLSLIQALDTATGQCDHVQFRNVLIDIRKKVEGGKGLSESFALYSNIFDPLYINLTRVGEVAGILDQVLLRIASYQEKAEGMRRKIRQAMAYPIVVMVVAIGATAFLLTAIVPTFAEMFTDFGAELPAPTRFILSLSSGLTQNLWLIVLLLIVLAGVSAWLRSKPDFLQLIDRCKFNIPLIGNLIGKSLIARFCRTLGTLLESGVNLVDALAIIGSATGNRHLDKKIMIATRQVSQGRNLYTQLQKTELFPELVVHMIMVGEQTAELDQMLIHAAEFYEIEVDATLESVGSILEPVLIVVIGFILGGILVALYLPMFDLINVIG